MANVKRRTRQAPPDEKQKAQEAAEKLLERLDVEMLGDGRRVSPVIEVKNGGRTHKVRFIQLADHRKQLLRVEAMGWVEDTRRRIERKYSMEEIREGQVAWEDLRGARWNMLIIQAATRKADDVEQEAFSLREIEEGGASDLLGYLGAKYNDFEDEWSSDKVTPEEIDAVIDLLKKNEVSLPVLWAQCGFAMLSACLLTMADRLATLETEQSSRT